MQEYQASQAIDFTIPFVDSNGNAIVVTGVTWTVTDEENQVVTSGTSIPAVEDTTINITILAEHCVITNGERSEARQLKVELTHAAGTETFRELFMLVEEHSLALGLNSCVTYLQALRMMPDFPTFVAMPALDDARRKSALIAAWRNIGLMELSEGALVDVDGQPIRTEKGELIWSTSQLKPDMLSRLDKRILKDFRHAQMEEAEYLLGGDGIEDLRSRGVMSYTVGEIKQFFRTSKPVELVLSKHALRHIGKYVQYHRKLARA